VSQMPEMPAAGWAEQDYDPSAYPRQAEAQPAQSAVGWQQDTEPDWGASQQGYAGNDYAAQQQYPQQQYPEYPPQQAAAQDAGSGLPTEFDHLFRDSTPDSRRAIDRQKPMVGGAGAGYLAGSQSAAMPEAAMPDQTAVAPQSGAYQQPFPPQGEQYGEQYGEQFPGPAPAAYQGAEFQGGPYVPADYQQGGGSGGGFGGGGTVADRLRRNPKPLIIGGAVALAAIIGIVIATSGGSSGKTPVASTSGAPTAPAGKTSPKQQADQIYQLIQQSGQLRSDANTAVVDVNGCQNLANAASMLSSTAQKRQAQADNVGKLDVSGIQNGAQLVGQLKAAWTASAQYDNAYAAIAGDVQHGCKSSAVHKDSNQNAAASAASAADTAKAQAAQLWNDNVATPLGESQVSSDKL
jgi:hypothetical protein